MKYLGAILLILGLCLPALAVEDITPPVLVSWTLAPTTGIDTSSAARSITATLVITDALSGFQRGAFYWQSPNNSQNISVSVNAGHLTSGTVNSGTYSVPFTIPQYANTGIWKLSNVTISDAVGNYLDTRAGEAILAGYETLTTQ